MKKAKKGQDAKGKDESNYRRAESLIGAGKLDEGVALLSALARDGSKYWEVYNDLGALAFAQQRHEQAIEQFERAAKLEPRPGLATKNLASLQKLLGRTARAISLYSKVLAVDPSDGEAQAGLGALLAPSASPSPSPASDERGLIPRYEPQAPSPSTIAGIFASSWKSALPGTERQHGAAMFDDQRPGWLASQLPGGLHFKSVLELGPFEGYQTYLLDRLGAREIVSVEGNSLNFLKCLCVKELYGLKARLEHGDVIGYMENCTRRFELVFASGVLYHMQDPLRFVELAASLAPALYLWTHFFDPSVLSLNNGQERHFVPSEDREVVVDGRTLRLHARSYLMRSYHESIPSYWEGGQEDLTYWLEREDLIWAIERSGMKVSAIQAESDVNGLPCISLCAQRS